MKYILFGSGGYGKKMLHTFGKTNVECFVDNNVYQIGDYRYGIRVISYEEYLRIYKQFKTVISVSEENCVEIMEQLEGDGITEYFLCDDFVGDRPIDSYNNLRIKHQKFISDYYKRKYISEYQKSHYLIDHINPKDLLPAKGYMRMRQLKMVAFASEVIEMLSSINIHPFLIAGNLLGYIRHSGFVPWDDDMDFGLMRDEYDAVINFCKNNFKVCVFTEQEASKNSEWEWIDKTTKDNKNQYILFLYSNMMQISKGTSCLDRCTVDFFGFDRYKREYSFEKHKEVIDEMLMELNDVMFEDKKMEIVKKFMIRERKYIDEKGENIYYSLDDFCAYIFKNNNWMKDNQIFPLRKVDYEGYNFYIPYDEKTFIQFAYKNYKEIPEDVGVITHGYLDTYKRESYLTVEFYLVDSFEIYHFLPLYNLFRNKGIYAIFVAEPSEINTSKKWFDYKRAKEILNELNLEYKEYCTPDTKVAFTTQDATNLRKYKNMKINMCYGCALNKSNYEYSIGSTKGFDYKLVHGEFMRNVCLEKGYLREDHIKIIGWPKHYMESDEKINKLDILKELGINTNKKIICYLPTWDEDSSISLFFDAFMELKKEYFIVTKPHHCTYRLSEKKLDMDKLYKISDIVLDCNFNFGKAVMLGDMLVVDAKSGASFEARLLNNNVPELLLSVRENVDEYFYSKIHEYMDIINNPSELCLKISNLIMKENMKKNNLNELIDTTMNTEKLWSIFVEIFKDIR